MLIPLTHVAKRRKTGENMSSESTTMSPLVPNELRESWRYLMGAGIVIAILGVLAIFAPFVTGVGLSILLGAFLVVGGIVHFAHAFSARGWTGSLWQIVLAIVYAVAGISLLVNPVFGLTTLTILLIIYLLVDGVAEIIVGLQSRSEPRWGWLVASGVISLVLAGLLWAGFPSTALWAIGLLFGISLLSTGISMVAIAYGVRKLPESVEPEMPAGAGGV